MLVSPQQTPQNLRRKSKNKTLVLKVINLSTFELRFSDMCCGYQIRKERVTDHGKTQSQRGRQHQKTEGRTVGGTLYGGS